MHETNILKISPSSFFLQRRLFSLPTSMLAVRGSGESSSRYAGQTNVKHVDFSSFFPFVFQQPGLPSPLQGKGLPHVSPILENGGECLHFFFFRFPPVVTLQGFSGPLVPLSAASQPFLAPLPSTSAVGSVPGHCPLAALCREASAAAQLERQHTQCTHRLPACPPPPCVSETQVSCEAICLCKAETVQPHSAGRSSPASFSQECPFPHTQMFRKHVV